MGPGGQSNEQSREPDSFERELMGALPVAVAELRGNLNEAAVTNSVAISRTVMGVLTPLQIATMMATVYP